MFNLKLEFPCENGFSILSKNEFTVYNFSKISSTELETSLTAKVISSVFQDQETSNSPKNDTPMTCLNMKLRSCPRVIYELDISVQAMRLSLLFFSDNVLIFTLLMCYY